MGYTGPFTIHYVCDPAHTGNVVVNAGSFQTISGIPTGNRARSSRPRPRPRSRATRGARRRSRRLSIVIATVKDATVEVTIEQHDDA